MLAASALAACRAPTELTFVVTTDVPCSSVKSTTIAVATLPTLDGKAPATTSDVCAGGRIGSLVVVPSGGEDAEVAVQVVTGVDGISADECARRGYRGGCIVARRSLHYSPHMTLTVPIEMDASCRDVACDPDKTCLQGACVSATMTCTSDGCTLPSTSAPTPTPTPTPTRWRAMRSGAAGGVAARSHPVAVWTGREMLVWGGELVTAGGLYDPSADTWRAIPAGPLGERGGTMGVWSGKELIVWGGYTSNQDRNDGAAFDPATGAWRTIAASPLSGRTVASAVWSTTTGEMLVWGGKAFHGGNTFADGAAYNPVTDAWRSLEPAPIGARGFAAGIWLGDRMLVFNGLAMDGALYDPRARAWSQPIDGPIAPRDAFVSGWGGDPASPVAFWGGIDESTVSYDDGVLWDQKSQQFTPIPTASTVLADPARSDGAGWVTPTQLYVWGGAVTALVDGNAKLTKVLGDGAVFDFKSAKWTALPSDGAPSARHGPAAVWTGREAIVWGGEDLAGNALDDGAIFGP